MVSTKQSIYSAKNFDFSDIILTEAKKNEKSKHKIQYRYFQFKDSKNRIFIQTPKLSAPFGLKYNPPIDGGSGYGNWTITLNFSCVDSKKYIEEDKIEFYKDADQGEVDFFNFCHELDNFVKKNLSTSKTRVQKSYKPFIRIIEKNDGSGEYWQPQVTLKVASFGGFQLKAIDQNSGKISNGKGNDEESLITPRSDVVAVFSLGRVYVMSDKIGPQCFVDRVKYWPQATKDDMEFIDDDGNIENLTTFEKNKLNEESDDEECDELKFVED